MKRRVKIFGARTLFELETEMNKFLDSLTLNYHIKDIGIQKDGNYYLGHLFYYVKEE